MCNNEDAAERLNEITIKQHGITTNTHIFDDKIPYP